MDRIIRSYLSLATIIRTTQTSFTEYVSPFKARRTATYNILRPCSVHPAFSWEARLVNWRGNMPYRKTQHTLRWTYSISKSCNLFKNADVLLRTILSETTAPVNKQGNRTWSTRYCPELTNLFATPINLRSTAYLPPNIPNLPIHSAYKVWHHLGIFNKHHPHPSFSSPQFLWSKPDASICLETYPTKSFRRTNDLVLAKAVMYCEGHKASCSASCIYMCVCVCKFFFCRASQASV